MENWKFLQETKIRQNTSQGTSLSCCAGLHHFCFFFSWLAPQNKFSRCHCKCRVSSLFFEVNFLLRISFSIFAFSYSGTFFYKKYLYFIKFCLETEMWNSRLKNNLRPISYFIDLHCPSNQSSCLIPHNLVSTIAHSSPVYKKYISLISLMSFVVVTPQIWKTIDRKFTLSETSNSSDLWPWVKGMPFSVQLDCGVSVIM